MSVAVGKGWRPRDEHEYEEKVQELLAPDAHCDNAALVRRIESTCTAIEATLTEAAYHCKRSSSVAEADGTKERLHELIRQRRVARISKQDGSQSVSQISKEIQRELRAIRRAKKRSAIAKALAESKSLRSATASGSIKKKTV